MKKAFIDRYHAMKGLDKQAAKPQKIQRGLDFERLINDVMIDEGISLSSGYYTTTQSEQIDGAVNIHGRICLLEAKWVNHDLAASDLYAFIGKVENKFVGTMGLFISHKQLKDNFIESLNRGRRQSVIVVHGDDIGHIFSSGFNFLDYLKRALEVLSIDHRLHFPVKDFLDSRKPNQPGPLANEDNLQQVKVFINEMLLKNAVSELQMVTALGPLTMSSRNDLFKNVINTYHKYRSSTGLYLQHIDKIRNFEQFLILADPDEKTKAEAAKTYFTELLWPHLEIYAREPFLKLLTPAFLSHYQKWGKTFEEALTSRLPKILGNYHEENAITEIIRPTWNHLSESTKEQVFQFYFDIYISDRKDHYAQKQYANQLMAEPAKIPRKAIESWLVAKTGKFKASRSDMSDYDILNFARTYWPVARSVYPQFEAWQTAVQQRLKA